MPESTADKALRGVGQLLFSRVASKIISFAFLIAFVRLLEPVELATLPLYYAASAAAMLFFSFGIPVTLVREIPRLRVIDLEQMKGLLFTGFVIVMSGVVATALLAWSLKDPILEFIFSGIDSDTTYQLIVLGMISGGWHNLLTFVIKSLQEYRSLAIYNALYEMTPKAFGLLGYFIGEIDGLLLGFVVGGMLCNLLYTTRFSSFIFGIRKLQPIAALLKLSWPFYIERYLHYFRNNGDVLVISALLGATPLALFYVAKRLYQMMVMLSRSIQDVVAPSLSQLLGESIDTATKGYARVALLVPIPLIPLGIFCAALSYAFLDVVIGGQYAHSATVTTALFCLVAILDGLVGIQTRAVFVLGKNTDRLKIVISQLVIYFPLLYLLVMRIGINGAPLAQGISYLLALAYTKHLISRSTSYKAEGYFIWKITIASIVGAVTLAALQFYHYSPLLIPVYLAISAGVFVLTIWLMHSRDDFYRIENAMPRRLKRYTRRFSRNTT